MLKKYIGDKEFYKKLLIVAIPIVLQNGITNFVSMLDNIMVGKVGTEQMSGVAIVNQLIFVFNICIFGVVSGAGIFTTQYYGSGNQKGVRDTFRFKIAACMIASLIGIAIFLGFGGSLISMYLKGEGDIANLQAAFHYGKDYLTIMLISFIPFAIIQAYSGTLRECGETVLPMKAGIVSVFVNLIFNYILIFGHFGAPKLGVMGAAISTVMARFVELLIVVVYTHRNAAKHTFIVDAYQSLKVPIDLMKNIIIKGSPLIINEALWASGMAIMMQCYSLRGLDVVAAMNISSTISNVFNVVFIAMGSAIAIIVGQLLGAGKMQEAKDTARKLIFTSSVCCIGIGAAMAGVSGLFPQIYETSTQVKALAAVFICVASAFMPLYAFTHASYFTLRSGGKTFVTFLFDSVFVWCVCIPTAFVLSRYTNLAIIPLYIACQSLEIIKCIIGFILVKKGIWLQNIVAD